MHYAPNQNLPKQGSPIAEAYGIFSTLLGRNVHMEGVIEFYPFGAPGANHAASSSA